MRGGGLKDGSGNPSLIRTWLTRKTETQIGRPDVISQTQAEADMSLYKRLTITGTLSEPKGTPDPLFALPSTVNWMRALAFLVAYKGISSTSARSFYSSVSERHGPEQEQNTVLEQLLFALHQCSALRVLRTAACKADVARVGIVTWYYGIYAAASAMTVAQ